MLWSQSCAFIVIATDSSSQPAGGVMLMRSSVALRAPCGSDAQMQQLQKLGPFRGLFKCVVTVFWENMREQ